MVNWFSRNWIGVITAVTSTGLAIWLLVELVKTLEEV